MPRLNQTVYRLVGTARPNGHVACIVATEDCDMGIVHAPALLRRLRVSASLSRAGCGFTLVELLVTIAIAGILLAVGVPAMQQFLADQAAAASADELAEGLRLARAEAMKRGLGVRICASTTTFEASPTCSGDGGDWLSGWLIVDGNGNVLRVQNPMRSISSVDSSDEAEVGFHANGLVSTGDASFVLTPVGGSNANRVRTVSVNLQGRVKVEKGGS